MTDMLSQDEIDALLGGNGNGIVETPEESQEIEDVLTRYEQDAIGEIGNINMGTSATTLFALLNQKVTITTPRVKETTLKLLASDIVHPCIIVIIRYSVGIKGINLLILKEDDVKIITDLMMGGDGTNKPDELTEMHLSAINEAMNQMIGSASTSLSDMLGKKIDITPPEVIYSEMKTLDIDNLGIDPAEHLVKVSFKMTVGDLIDSEIMQIIPIDIAKDMIQGISGETEPELEEKPHAEPQQTEPEPSEVGPQHIQQPRVERADNGGDRPVVRQRAPVQQNAIENVNIQHNPVNAMPFQFDSFENVQYDTQYGTEIDLIRDVPLEITVELGRTKKKICEILELGVGSVIELDKLVGESLDILANGKKIAMGEVVVVDENYGIRLAEIISGTKGVR